MHKLLSHLVFPLLIVGSGVAGAAALVKGAGGAEAKAPLQLAPIVEVVEVEPADYANRVEANGVLEPTSSLNLIPEVGGKVVFVADSLVEGGRVEAGELLVRIEATAYKIALSQARAELARAQAELDLEQGRVRSASREWERFGKASGEDHGGRDAGRLAKRGPQLASAQALVDLRKAAVDKAKFDLRRASIRAPFSAIVSAEQVEPGQVVSQGSSLATLVASEQLWVRAPVRLDALSAIHLADASPGDDKSSAGSEARKGSEVRMRLNTGRGRGQKIVGEALRLGPEIDRDTRKAELIIGVPQAKAGETPLLPGAFVTLELDARHTRDALKISRQALVQGRRVWVLDDEDRLVRLDLDIAWSERDHVYVLSDSLDTKWRGQTLRVVMRPSGSALEGVKVRVADAAIEAVDEDKTSPTSAPVDAEAGEADRGGQGE